MKTLLALLLLSVSCLAEVPLTFPSITTTKGVTYKSVKISRFDATEVRFIHDGGAAVVPLHELPEELQKVFGYDPVKASFEVIVKQDERRRSIIEDADKKAKNYAILEQQKKDADELKSIRDEALRCSVSQADARTVILEGVRSQQLLARVLPVEKLPVTFKTKSGHVHIKSDGWGKPELAEQIVKNKAFILGSTIRIVPSSAVVMPGSIITVYLIEAKPDCPTLCALTAEDAFKYRREIALSKAQEGLTEAKP